MEGHENPQALDDMQTLTQSCSLTTAAASPVGHSHALQDEKKLGN
jgi:hypothetical protein